MRTVLVVPAGAIIQRGSLPMVYVAKEDNKKELRIVRLGERVDPYNVTVISGLQPGELVFIEPEYGEGGSPPPQPPAQRGPPPYPGQVPPGY